MPRELSGGRGLLVSWRCLKGRHHHVEDDLRDAEGREERDEHEGGHGVARRAEEHNAERGAGAHVDADPVAQLCLPTLGHGVDEGDGDEGCGEGAGEEPSLAVRGGRR